MRGDYDSSLFRKQSWHDAETETFKRNGIVHSATNKIPKDRFLTTPDHDLTDHIYSELSLEPLTLHEDRTTRTYNDDGVEVIKIVRPLFENRAIQVPAEGCSIEVSIPFTGDTQLWDLTPNPHQSIPPQGDVHAPKNGEPGRIVLTFLYALDNLDEKTVSKDIDRALDSIRFNLNSQKGNVKAYNLRLHEAIENAVTSRKDRLLNAAGIMGRLGITLERDQNAPIMTPLQLTPKVVRPLPSSPKYQFSPEPGLDSGQFEQILSVLRHITRTYETTPVTFGGHDEEELRDLMLAHLNAYFKGGATGETFRKHGKTDIRIEDNRRSAFVAECKVWKGPSAFRATIDQLLGYLTWRDCKAAIIVFNKHNSGFSGIRSKISSELLSHALFKLELENKQGQGEWREVYRSSEDELREVIVHVFAVDLFVGDSTNA